MDSLAKFRAYVKACGIEKLLNSARAVVVGFSGGADSALLLTLMAKEYPSLVIAAAHLNHGLRGDEATRDNDFCRDFCKRRGIRFFETAKNISAIAEERGEGTEECGRNERYKFFDECRKQLAAELSCDVSSVLSATAHNADDNLETVIFNLTRGTGLRGLRGIPPIRDGYCVRPLLAFTSANIREICEAEGIPYVVDSTNLEDGYTRNRIRHSIIPELEKINPGVRETVLSMCRVLTYDEKYIDEAASRIGGEGGSAASGELLSLPRAVAARVISKMYRGASGESLSSQHIEAVFRAISSGEHGRLHLPHCVTAYYGDTLEFVAEEEKDPERDYLFGASFGEHDMKELGFSVGFYPDEESFNARENNIYKELIYKIRINDKIINNLFVRNRKESDVYFIRSHHRKLKKLMCDAKIPVRKRDILPVVCDGEGILWVPGFPARDGTFGADGIIITYSEFREEDRNEQH